MNYISLNKKQSNVLDFQTFNIGSDSKFNDSLKTKT